MTEEEEEEEEEDDDDDDDDDDADESMHLHQQRKIAFFWICNFPSTPYKMSQRSIWAQNAVYRRPQMFATRGRVTYQWHCDSASASRTRLTTATAFIPRDVRLQGSHNAYTI